MRIFDHRAASRLRAPPPHSSVDESLVSRALEPYWCWVAARTPAWVSPNLITLSGLALVALAFAAMMVAAPSFEGSAPAWTYAAAIAALFAFQTLDAVDGKHARRTGTSSALGSWLDHACDVIAVQLAMATVACALDLGTGGLALFLMGSVLLNNFIIHWETKHTGTLFMGNGTSIYEAQVTLMVVHAVTLAAGKGLWHARPSSVVPRLADMGVLDAPLQSWIVVIGVGAIGGVGIVGSLRRVHRLARREGSPFAARLVDLAPMIFLLGVAAAAHAASDDARVPLTFAASLLGLRLIGRVILEHLADLAPKRLDLTLGPMLLTATALVLARAGVLPGGLDSAALGWANLAFAVAVSGRFFVGATLEAARAIGVPILTLPPSTAPTPPGGSDAGGA